MFRIKWICIWILWFIVTNCVTVTIPEAYNFRVRELQSNPYGCWMEIVATTGTNQNLTISGELLNLSEDSTYLLVADGKVRSFKNTSILTANLYTHKNQANTFLTISSLLAVPAVLGAIIHSDYGGGFLITGAPVMVVGVIHSLFESAKKRNILIYPGKNSLDDMSLFARFPAGMPEKINYHLLYLKKMQLKK